MRIPCGAMLAAGLSLTLFVTGAFAEPLSPGYPAGVRAARGGGMNTALMIGTGAVIMGVVGILASGSSSVLNTAGIPSQPVLVGPSITVSTSTTS